LSKIILRAPPGARPEGGVMTTTEPTTSFIDGATSGLRHTDEMPWVPFPGIENSEFKLLRFDRETDGGIALLRMRPGGKAPLHTHFGSMEYYMLEGNLSFGSTTARPGTYWYELGGFTHQDDPPDDCEVVMLVIAHGPLQATLPDGGKGPVLGFKVMSKLQERYIAEQA
jgi:anti-sigma factor ChrR (cupin superfamily)